MQCGRADTLQLGLPLAPHDRVGSREVEAVYDGANIEAAPTNKNRNDSAAAQVGDDLARHGLELRHRGGLGDIHDVDQVVVDPRQLIHAGFGGPDLHPAIDQHRVRIDHLCRLTMRAE